MPDERAYRRSGLALCLVTEPTCRLTWKATADDFIILVTFSSKTWLRSKLCQEDINNSRMGHNPRRRMSELYSPTDVELEQGLREVEIVGVGFEIPTMLLQMLRNFRLNWPSLTTPAVSRVFFSFFLLLITEFAHTYPSTHEACPFGSSLFTCGTLTCSARFRSSIQCCPPNISSITINHDELFELPLLQ